ncbi:MAG TPA: hypothetical protein VME23_17490 [Terracidiphilus sp.]|jgi:hypothetical protein|nr:hypothetical protein [Terracidiphilus sp.]
MPFVPAMLVIWGVILVFFLAVKVYASRLSRDEDDQLILDDSFGHLKAEQDAIMSKLNKFKPVQLTATWALGAATLFVVIYYVHDMISQFK